MMRFDSHKVRIAVAASPDPRNMPLIRKSRMMLAFPPSNTAVYREPMWITLGSAPISPSNRGANRAPPIPAAAEITMRFTCTRGEIRVDLSTLKSDGRDDPASFPVFRKADQLVLVDDGQRQAVATFLVVDAIDDMAG